MDTTANPYALPTTYAEQVAAYERLFGEKPSCVFDGTWNFMNWVDPTGPVLVCATHGYQADGLVYACPDDALVGLCAPEADAIARALRDAEYAAEQAAKQDAVATA
jgi:hypothetical protein